jgi:hypothetical protein
VRLALWTPRPDAAWVARLLPQLACEAELRLIAGRDAGSGPAADLDLYHVANHPAHGFVLHGLSERPGLVLLADWSLARLVHAETVGRGDPGCYLAEARRSDGVRGAFIARQELAGLSSETLSGLLTLNQRVLDASLGLAAATAVLRAKAAALLPGRPVVHVAFEAPEPAPVAEALLALAREILPSAESARRAYAARRAEEGSPLGRALSELQWAGRELGLASLPPGTEPLVAPLFRAPR